MPNVCLSYLLLSLFVFMLALIVVPLVFVFFLVIGTLSNEVLHAATIVASPLLLVGKPSLHYLIPILFQPLVIAFHEQSHVINLHIISPIIFIFT